MDQEMLTLTLGREELIFLLRLFHVPTLPELGEDPLAGMSEEQAAAALASAERSLRARGLLRVVEKEKRVEVDPVAMALVGSCLRPRFSLLVSFQIQGGELARRYYHVASHLTVEHTSPEIGIDRFIGVAEPSDMFPRIADTLHITDQAALSCPPSRVRESILTQVRDRVRAREVEIAQALLRQEGVPDATAYALIETLAQPISNSSIVRIEGFGSQDKQVQGFSLLEGNNGLWALIPDNQEEGDLWVRIEPISAEIVKDRLAKLLA